jgi:hypothetical protein
MSNREINTDITNDYFLFPYPTHYIRRQAGFRQIIGNSNSIEPISVIMKNPLCNTIEMDYTEKKTFITGEEDICSICLKKNCYITTQCGHTYCSCILKNIIQKNNYHFDCPICRQKIVKLTFSNEYLYDLAKNMLEITTQFTNLPLEIYTVQQNE